MTPSSESPLEAETAPAELAMPDGCFFAYVISKEAWYADVVRAPEVNVSASAEDGGVAWEFSVEEVDLGSHTAIRVKVFDDAFAAFEQVPGFFAALAAEKPLTLAEIVGILDRLGARDTTERVNPNDPAGRQSVPASVRNSLLSMGWTPPGGA